MTDNADYTYLAHRFNRKNGVNLEGGPFSEEVDAQYNVYKEEVEELEKAYNESRYHDVKEELADVLVTLFILAERMDIDIDECYQRKMEYNLQKSGERNSEGKIVDDADVEKPNFEEIDGGFRP